MNLKAARDLAGLNQTVLAERAKLTQQDISSFELGTKEPSFVQLTGLIEALRQSGLRGITAPDLDFGRSEEAQAS